MEHKYTRRISYYGSCRVNGHSVILEKSMTCIGTGGITEIESLTRICREGVLPHPVLPYLGARPYLHAYLDNGPSP